MLDNMLKKECYLIVGAEDVGTFRQRLRQPRVVSASGKKTPAVKKGEVAIRFDLELPVSLFKSPQLSATVRIGEDQVSPESVSADVINQIENVVRQHGINITLMNPE